MISEYFQNLWKSQFLSTIINERSEFFRGLSEKSEYERPSPAQPSPAQPGPARGDGFERRISLRRCIRFAYGLHSGIGPFKLP